MSGFQNTKTRTKDGNTPDASTTVVSHQLTVGSNAATGTVRVAEFIANTSSGAANVAIAEAILAKTVVGIGTTPINLNTRVAAAHFELDFSSNAGASVTNSSYCAVFSISANTATRTAARPTAFLAFNDYGSAKANGVKFLLDIGTGNSTTGYVNVTTSGATDGVYKANTAATANGVLSCRVNGATKYIPLYDALA